METKEKMLFSIFTHFNDSQLKSSQPQMGQIDPISNAFASAKILTMKLCQHVFLPFPALSLIHDWFRFENGFSAFDFFLFLSAIRRRKRKEEMRRTNTSRLQRASVYVFSFFFYFFMPIQMKLSNLNFISNISTKSNKIGHTRIRLCVDLTCVEKFRINSIETVTVVAHGKQIHLDSNFH